MTQSSASTLVSLVVMGCGPSVDEEPTPRNPALVERCGSTEPIQVLALAPNEAIEPYSLFNLIQGSALPHGNRWLFAVSTYDREIAPTESPWSEEPPTWLSSRIVSVDRCGGDVRVLAEDAQSVRAPTGNEPWTACSTDGGRLIVLDPEQERSGQLYPELYCTNDVVDDAFITVSRVEGEQRALVRARLRFDGPADITVITPINGAPHVVQGSSMRLLSGFDSELVEVDVLTGQARILRTDVYRWSASDDGRFVSWSPYSPSSEPQINAPLLLWDRQTDEERQLGAPEWPHPRFYDVRGNVVLTRPDDDDPDVTQLILLPSGDELLLDGSWSGVAKIGETHVLRGSSALMIFAPGDALPRTIFPDDPGVVVFDEQLWLLDDNDDDDVPSPSHSLLQATPPDFTPRLVAGGLHSPLRLSDGRLLTVLDLNAEGSHGTLVLVDANGSTRGIDRDVLGSLYSFNNEGGQRSDMAPLVDDVVVYPVRDADHERTGVWIAQIAPSPEP